MDPNNTIINTENNNQLGYVNPTTKKEIGFQQRLANMTASDFRHDFKIDITTKSLQDKFVKGLPGISGVDVAQTIVVTDEGATLNGSIVGMNNNDDQNFNMNAFLTRMNESEGGSGEEIDIGYSYQNQKVIIAKYKVIKFSGLRYKKYKEGFNPNERDDTNQGENEDEDGGEDEGEEGEGKDGEQGEGDTEGIDPNFAKNFREITNIDCDTGKATLILDFSQHGFISKLKQGDDAKCIINYIATPETVNDPAGKTNVHDNIFDPNNKNGFEMRSYMQTTPGSTFYTPYDENNPATTNNFFSKYNFDLSPIMRDYKSNDKFNMTTNLIIGYSDPALKNPYLTDAANSKTNSIKQIKPFITNLISSFKGLKNMLKLNQISFDFNTKLQQKRSGDWFQALCCLNLKNNDFTRIKPALPATDDAYKLNTQEDLGPVYLVTHDRIALAYCLTNGVNAIYLRHNGDTIVFKNLSDPQVKKGERPEIEQVRDRLSDFLTKKYENFKPQYQFYEKIRGILNEIIETKIESAIRKDNVIGYDAFERSTANTNINIADLKDTCKKMLEGHKSTIKDIYRETYGYSYIHKLLPDMKNQYKMLEDSLRSLLGGDVSDRFNEIIDQKINGENPENVEHVKDQIKKILYFINNITGALKILDSPETVHQIQEDEMKAYCESLYNKLYEKLQQNYIYTSIDNILSFLESESKKKTIFKRIMGAVKLESKSTKVTELVYDKNIFLQGMQNLPRKTFDILHEHFNKLNNYMITCDIKVKAFYEGKRTKPDETLLDILRIPANLFHETLIFLGNPIPIENNTGSDVVMTAGAEPMDADSDTEPAYPGSDTEPIYSNSSLANESSEGFGLNSSFSSDNEDMNLNDSYVKNNYNDNVNPTIFDESTDDVLIAEDLYETCLNELNDGKPCMNSAYYNDRTSENNVQENVDEFGLATSANAIGGGIFELGTECNVFNVLDTTLCQVTWPLLSNIFDRRDYFTDYKKYFKISSEEEPFIKSIDNYVTILVDKELISQEKADKIKEKYSSIGFKEEQPKTSYSPNILITPVKVKDTPIVPNTQGDTDIESQSQYYSQFEPPVYIPYDQRKRGYSSTLDSSSSDESENTKLVVKTLHDINKFEMNVSSDDELTYSNDETSPFKKLRPTDSTSTDLPPTTGGANENQNAGILKDYSFCFHPLVPIYVLLTSFNSQLGPDFNESPFYKSYVIYFNILEKMANTLIENYLSNNDEDKHVEASLIGYSLRSLFFTTNKSVELFTILKKILDVTTYNEEDKLRMYCMLNDSFSESVVGTYVVKPNSVEEVIGIVVLTSDVFTNFLKNEIKLKKSLSQKVRPNQIPRKDPNDPLAYTSGLKNELNILMYKVASKIKQDRKGETLDEMVSQSFFQTPFDSSSAVQFEQPGVAYGTAVPPALPLLTGSEYEKYEPAPIPDVYGIGVPPPIHPVSVFEEPISPTSVTAQNFGNEPKNFGGKSYTKKSTKKRVKHTKRKNNRKSNKKTIRHRRRQKNNKSRRQ